MLYLNLPKEAITLGKLEIKQHNFTDYSLLYSENAKTLAYEPILKKLRILKREEKKKGAISKKTEEKSDRTEEKHKSEPKPPSKAKTSAETAKKTDSINKKKDGEKPNGEKLDQKQDKGETDKDPEKDERSEWKA